MFLAVPIKKGTVKVRETHPRFREQHPKKRERTVDDHSPFNIF